MMKKEFWKDWKSLSNIEKTAIVSIRKAKSLLLASVSKQHIVAVYVKGSFIRREMNKDSDVDIVVIVDNNKIINDVLRLDRKKGRLYRPAELLCLSTWELKHMKRYHNRLEKGPKGAPSIDDFAKYKLIYGNALDFSAYPVRKPENRLRGLINAHLNIFLPMYEKKEISFSVLVKQVFWLTHYEQVVKKVDVGDAWKDLVSSVKNKSHIVHDAHKFRFHPTGNFKARAKFVKKLKAHVNRLARKYC